MTVRMVTQLRGELYRVRQGLEALPPTIDLSSVADGTTGFKLSGEAANDRAGSSGGLSR